MKQNLKSYLILSITFIALLSSCTLQKRYHSAGFTLQFTKKSKVVSVPSTKSKITQKITSNMYAEVVGKRISVDQVCVEHSSQSPLVYPLSPRKFRSTDEKQISKNPIKTTDIKQFVRTQKNTTQNRKKVIQQIKKIDPLGDLLILLIILIAALFGVDLSNGGGGGWDIDWTIVLPIISVVLGGLGVISVLIINTPTLMAAWGFIPALILVGGVIVSLVGLVKSFIDYYDTGKLLCLIGLVLLAIMVLIGFA